MSIGSLQLKLLSVGILVMIRGPTASGIPNHHTRMDPYTVKVMRPGPKKPAVAGPWTIIQNPVDSTLEAAGSHRNRC